MFPAKQLEKRLIDEGYTRSPYGWKRILSDTKLEIVIEPGKHTGIDVKDLDEHGLRGHPDTRWERVTHLGYVDGKRSLAGRFLDFFRRYSLVYTYLDFCKRIQERRHKKGNMFYSVLPDGRGERHLITNASKRHVRLLIESEKG
jgi:hypothetical protein